jgi:peptidase M10/serralysin-like protein
VTNRAHDAVRRLSVYDHSAPPLAGGPVSADVDVGSGVTRSATVVLHGEDVLTIDEGGMLDVSTGAAIVWADDAVDVTVDNAGTILGHDGGVLQAEGGTGSLTFNNASTGLVQGFLNIDDSAPGAAFTFNNSGRLLGGIDLNDAGETAATINNLAGGVMNSASASQDIIDGGEGTVVNNFGVIRVAADVVSDEGEVVQYGGRAVYFNQHWGEVYNHTGAVIEGSQHAITGRRGLIVVNDEGGLLVGRNGSAVNVDNNGSVEQTAYVTNHGTMQGRSANYEDSDGDAIDSDGLLQLDNYGTIQGLGAAGYHDGGLNTSEAVAMGGGVINNYKGGVIFSVQRAIQVDDSEEGSALAKTSIYNAGRIEGADGRAINIVGGFSDTIVNKGVIVGSVLTAGGSDVITAFTGSSFSVPVDTGSGLDRIVLKGKGEGDFAGALHAENLHVMSGSWVIGTSAFSQIVVDAAAVVTSSLDLAGGGVASIAAGAVLHAEDGPSLVVSGMLARTQIDSAGTIFGIGTDQPISGSIEISNALGGQVFADDGGAGIALRGDLGGGSATIHNDGDITGSETEALFAINLRDVTNGTVSLVNTGAIRTRADKDIIRGAENMTFENFGVVDSYDDDYSGATAIAGGDGVDFQGNAGGVVINHLYLSGSRHAITGDEAITVFNEGTILGRGGAGINIDNDGSVANTVHVTNRGYIFGQSVLPADSTVDIDGDGIDVDGLLQLDNYGLVDGFGANGLHDGQINVAEGLAIGGGTINNYGTIASSGRGIQVDDSNGGAALGALILYNEGTILGNEARVPGQVAVAINIVGGFADSIVSSGVIDGSISTDGGRDTITILDAGTVTGAIMAGAGADTVEGGAGLNLIDGGSGVDTISYAHAAEGVKVDLGLAKTQNTGGGGRDRLANFENATGSAFDDALKGDAGANLLTGGEGNDKLSGMDGADRIVGGAGADMLSGGAGSDVFVFSQATDSDVASTDRIFDLDAGDRIDLSAIDADVALKGDQAFTVVDSFDGHAGELVLDYRAKGDVTWLLADVDGDGAADVQIMLRGGDFTGFGGLVL